MKNKHTPGPWTAVQYERGTLGYKNGKAFYIKSDDGTPAFQVLKSQTFDHRNGRTGHFWDPSAKAKDKANAQLIAAAPDLYSALVEMTDNYVNEVKEWGEANGEAVDLDNLPGVMEARAALKKSRGE